MLQEKTTRIGQPKRIVLGVTGGIAAYKSAELLRLLAKSNIAIQVVMTEAACHFITPATMQALSNNPVYTDQWNTGVPNGMAHINLSRDADAILVAPASADFISKLAHGVADDLLSALCLARTCPLIIAPAMNQGMWNNAATQRNITQLIDDGVHILSPDSGEQACGEHGMGRMREAAQLADDVTAFFQPRLLSGTNVLITAGPTYEAIDAVRGITNRSSGKMGYAVAQAALEMGASVRLISGPTSLDKPRGAQSVDVESAEQMYEEVKKHVPDCDIFIGVAAVADYRIARPETHKIKKGSKSLTLELVPNPDILAYVANLADPPFCVGFAAESENLEEFTEQKRRLKHLPLIVGNLVHQAIGNDDNELVLFDDQGKQTLARTDKLTLARQLMHHIAQRYMGT